MGHPLPAQPEGITNPPIDELLSVTGSKYELVSIAAQRARQINSYYAQLQEGDVDLTGVRFAVFGMGDASYTKTYSRGSELLTEALEARGATRVGEYGRHDASGTVPAGEAACEWAEGVLSNLTTEHSPA